MQMPSTTTMLAVGLPLVTGIAGAGYASYAHNKDRERIKQNLIATGNTLVTPANFGKHTDLAKQKFIELAAVAPNTMQRKELATSLLLKAIGTKQEDFVDVVRKATNVEDSLVRNRPYAGLSFPQSGAGAAFQGGVQIGTTLSPLVSEVLGVMPAGSVGGGGGQVPSGYFSKDQVNKELIQQEEAIAKQNLAQSYLFSLGVPPTAPDFEERKKKIVERLGKEPIFHESISAAVVNRLFTGAPPPSAGTTKQSSVSPEVLGDVLARQYCLAGKVCTLDKLAAFSPAFQNALLAAGAAVAGAAATVAIDKGVDAWKDYKNEAHFQSTYTTAMRRLEKGVAGDPYMESVKAKIESDPVHYKNMAREAFQLLADTSPHLAKHPIVAKSFMARVIQSEGEIPREEMNVYSKIRDPLEMARPLSERLQAGFRTFGGEAAFGTAAQEYVKQPGVEQQQAFTAAQNAKKMQSSLAQTAAQTAAQTLNQRSMQQEGFKQQLAMKDYENLLHNPYAHSVTNQELANIKARHGV